MFDLIFDNLGLLFVLVVAGISVVRKILEAAGANQQEGSPPELPVPGRPVRPAPRPHAPPPLAEPTMPPVRQPATPPPLRQAADSAPWSAHDTEAEVVRQRQMEERLRKIREAKATPAPQPLPVAQPRAETPKRPTAHGVLHRRLRHPQELRRAFVIKEILDRPMALRP